MSFPKFPQFHKLLPKDKDDYNHYYSNLEEPSADLSFDNALVWLDFHEDLEVSDLNNNLVIRFTDILSNDRLTYSLLGASRLEETLTTISAHTSTLSYISKPIVEAIRTMPDSIYTIEEDTDNNNYVYNVDSLAAMRGKAYENLRGRVNNFTKDNPNIHIEELSLASESSRKSMYDSILKWAGDGTYLRNDPANWEQPALKRYFNLAPFMQAKAYGIYTDTTLVSILLFNFPPQKDWIIASHIKCDYRYRESYGYTTYSLAIIAKVLGIKWINFEQDLGKEGLRRLKHFFNPEKFIRQYTVYLASEEFKHQ